MGVGIICEQKTIMKPELVREIVCVTLVILLICDVSRSLPTYKSSARFPGYRAEDLGTGVSYPSVQDPLEEASQEYFKEQKRRLCRKYFIYNPVRGRCMPTLMALKQRPGRRGFPI